MSDQGNKEAQKENEKTPEVKFRIMEDYNLNDREVKTVVMKKLHEI